MGWGIETYINGRAILTPNGAGGIFHSFVTFDNHDPAATLRFTLYDVPGSTIFVFSVRASGHAWVTGVDGSGYPYVESPGFPIPDWDTSGVNDYKTTVGIFLK